MSTAIRSSQGSLASQAYEWVKSGVPAWYEVRDEKGVEVYEFLPSIVKGLAPNKTHAKIIFASDNSEKEVPLLSLYQRNLDPSIVRDLTEIPILNDAEILTHLHLLYQNSEIYCYCGPSLIAINPYRNIPNTISPETMNLIKLKLQKRALDQAPPHVWTVSASAFKNMELNEGNQAICINGESGAGKTESTKKCLEFLTQAQFEVSSAEGNDLSEQILACNPILEAFGNSKTLRNDNSSRFGKYVKIYYDPKSKYRIMGSTMTNYLLEKSRVVSISKDERGFHIFYAVCRFMPLAMQKQYHLSKNGQPCDLSRFKILRSSGLYETPKINDKEFYIDVVNAFTMLGFSPADQDAIWRIISAVLHLGNFEVDSTKYKEGQVPCSIAENEDFMSVIRLLDCDPESLQKALTLRIRQVGNQIYPSPHRPENVVDFFLAMAKDLYNNLFSWIVKKLNVILARSLPPADKLNKLKTIGLLDIFGFEIFDKNYIEQLFINYANERLQGLYIDHIFKNECAIFKSEGLDKYVSLITYKDNLGLINAIDAPSNPPGIFSLTNQASRMNQKDESLMNEMKKAYAKPNAPDPVITFHKIKQALFYVRHTAREVEYTIDGFVDKNRDEISIGIVRTIENSLESIAKIYKGVVGDDFLKEDTTATDPNAKFLSYKFRINMNQLMDELHNSSCHFIRCVKPNEAKKPDNWVGYLVLKQITYMGLLDSLKVRKYNYPVRFKHSDFYKRYQDIDTNKEGSIAFAKLEAAGENFRKLAENLLGCVGIAWTERDLLIGKTRILMNDPFKYKIDEILKTKQKAKRESLAVIVDFYKNQMRRKRVHAYIKGTSRSIQLARNTLASINAKVEYVRFKRQMKLLRKFQNNFRKTQQYRNMALQYNKAKFIAKVCKLKLMQMLAMKVLKTKRAIKFVGDNLLTKIYRNRRKFCARIVNDLFALSWREIKSRYAEKSAGDIQRSYRSYFLRKKHAPAVQRLEEKVKTQIVVQSVLLIQAHIKGYLVRSRFRKLQMAARVIQGYFRSRWIRQYYLKLRKATIRIQKNFRKFYWKNTMIASKLQEFSDSTHNMRYLALKEYESLLGSIPGEVKANEIIDYEFQKWIKKLTVADSAFQKFLPSPPDVELTPKAKLFAIPFDLNVTSETLEVYPGTWAGELKSFAKKIHDKNERLIHINVSNSSTLCLTDDLRVYSFGANDYGQLCTDDSEKLFSGRVREIFNLTKNPALQFSLGRDNGAMVSQSGRAFFWGKFNENQLGLKSKKPIDGLVVQNGIKEEAIGVSLRGALGPAGEELSYVVGRSGQVYVFGLPNEEEAQAELGENKLDLLNKNNNAFNYSELEKEFEYKETQRNYHQSLATVANKDTALNGKRPSQKVYYKILELEDDVLKESTRQIRKTSPAQSKAKLKSSNSSTQLIKEIDPYKKIVYIASGSDFTVLLSDKGVLFSFGENAFGELGLGDNNSRTTPTPINTLRRANEKVEDISCGYKHVVCCTNLGKVYTWGLGSSHQNGSIRGKNISLPQEVQFNEAQVSSLTKIKNVAASAFGSYFFFEDGTLCMLGKCGPGTLTTPIRFPYNTRMFMGKMKEEFVPVKVFASWSNMLSIGYLMFLDFRDVQTAKNYKEKIAGLVASKWLPGNALPSYDENLYKYIQSKNMLKEKSVPLYIDVRYSSTSDGRPRSITNIPRIDETSDDLSINQKNLGNDIFENKRQANAPPNVFGKGLADAKDKNGIHSKEARASQQNILPNMTDQVQASQELNRRFEELKQANKIITQQAKVGKPPVIAPPMKGYKNEPLKAKILKVGDGDQIVSAQSIVIPQKVYHQATKVPSKSPDRKGTLTELSINGKAEWNIKNNQLKQISEEDKVHALGGNQIRSKSKSQPKLEPLASKNNLSSRIQNNPDSKINFVEQSPRISSNVFKAESRKASASKDKGKVNQRPSLTKGSDARTKKETLFDLPFDFEINEIKEDFSHVIHSQKNKHPSTYLLQSGFVNKSLADEQRASQYLPPHEEQKASNEGLNPALKRDRKGDSRYSFNNPVNSFLNTSNSKPTKVGSKPAPKDTKSKEGLFSQQASQKDLTFSQPFKQKKADVQQSKTSLKEPESKTKPALHESIFQEVEKIMKKEPSRWSNIEREIINSYVKLTKNLGR